MEKDVSWRVSKRTVFDFTLSSMVYKPGEKVSVGLTMEKRDYSLIGVLLKAL